MSLVVAEATPDGARIVSDTRVLHPGRPLAYKTGTLKAIVLRRDLTVCFTGEVEAGLGAIRQVASDLYGGRDVEGLLSTLQGQSRQRSVDFLVAADGRGWQLARIREGAIDRALESTWIGDQEAFERFQSTRLSAPEPFTEALEAGLGPGLNSMRRLGNAMDAVIADSTIESVDHFCVRVARGREGFEYMGSMFVFVGRDFELSDGDEVISKMAQPVEEGGFAVTVVEPAHPGTPALGLSFPRAQLGMLFLPLEYDQAQVIEHVSPNDYARLVQERFGVAMKDPPMRYA
jgi:hypothetical protein